MKLVIIGPGIMPIPPKGWGAVESLIWDYKIFIEKYYPDISVHIVNTENPNDIVMQTNNLNPDIIHIQYDNHAYLTSKFNCKNVILTSHYGYLDQMKERPTDAYMNLINDFINAPAKILCLSPSIANIYIHFGCESKKLFIQPNGANDEIFKFNEEVTINDKAIYLAKIDYRKKQYIYQQLPNIDFVGNYADGNFYYKHPNYKGEWTKEYLYEHLTDYPTLVLLSDGEAHPLVCCEALICGLGLVISEYASANLDTSLPFIDVIPNDKLYDLQYIYTIITKNIETSSKMRKEIREYGIKNFSWKKVVDNYCNFLYSLVK